MYIGRRAALRALSLAGTASGLGALAACAKPSTQGTAVTKPTATPEASKPALTEPQRLEAALQARLRSEPSPGKATGKVEHVDGQLATLRCAAGTLCATPKGAFLVPADIEQRWRGVRQWVGDPIAEVEPWVDGRRQKFATGNVIIAPGAHSDPTRLDVVVNKLRPLQPLEFSPADLVPWRGITVRALIQADAEAMVLAAQAQGVALRPVSGFRTYAYQVGLFASYEQQRGSEQTLIRSARPGFSEHQTGLAFDVGGDQGCELSACFADTAAAQWVAAHAHQFGFSVRYGFQQTHITGYDYEPWHLRYVGREVAADMVARKIYTLEQYYGLPAAPNYA